MLIASRIIVIIELKKGYYGEKLLLSCLFWYDHQLLANFDINTFFKQFPFNRIILEEQGFSRARGAVLSVFHVCHCKGRSGVHLAADPSCSGLFHWLLQDFPWKLPDMES